VNYGQWRDDQVSRPCRPRAAPRSLARICPTTHAFWAALQQAGGGTWGGCVYDVDAIVGKLNR